jgi:hypothetical protein
MVKIVVYIIMIVWTQQTTKDTKWLPWYLGGKIGSFDGMMEGSPF